MSRTPASFRCDDTAYGKGAGGELTYPVTVPAGGSRTIWFTVAGSDLGPADARAQFQAASADPAAELTAKIGARQQLNGQTQVSLPGDPALAQSVTWSKQDLADLTQQADNLQIRRTEEGTVYPPPAGFLPSIRFEGAGFRTIRGCSRPTRSTRCSPCSPPGSSRPPRTACARWPR